MDEQRKKEYKYPPILLLKEEELDPRKENENAEAVEKFFYYLENYFNDVLAERDLIGVRVFYNQTVLRYKFYDYTSSEHPSLYSLCECIAYKDQQKILKRETFSHSVKSDKADLKGGEVTCGLAHVNFKIPALIKTVAKNKDENGKITATFFANIKGDPEWVDLADKSVILLSDGKYPQKEKQLSSTLINLTYRYSPEEVKFIFLGKSNEFTDCFSGIPHMEFQKRFEKLEQIYPCLEWLKKIKEERKQLLKRAGYENISAYNTVNDKKLPHYVVVLSDYKEVKAFYNVYIEGLEALVKEVFNKDDGLGFSIIITANNGLSEGFEGELRITAPLKITFKTENAMASFRAIGKAGAERLLHDEEIMITEETLMPKQMLSYKISKEEIKAVCDYLRGEGLFEFNEDGYKWICEQAENGHMSNENRKKNEEAFLLKEIVKLTIKLRVVPFRSFVLRFKVKTELLLKVVEIAMDKKYIVFEKNNYKAKITPEEFEKIFGEKP